MSINNKRDTLAEKQKLLLIEDDRQIRQLYSLKFKKAGYEVSEAENGEDGLQLAEEKMPDLVVLDLKMPVMSGEEMLEKMRATDWGEAIPVIVLTNISRDEAPRSLAYLGIEDYIVKAMFTPTQVLQVVERVLAKNAK